MTSRGEPRISLFPFMSVLACTIGALMMLLVAMSLAAVAVSGHSIEALRATRTSTDVEREMLEGEVRLLDRAEAIWSEVDQALRERGLATGLASSSIEREIELERRRHANFVTLERIEEEKRRVVEERDSIETTILVLESRRETLPILIDSTGLSRHHRPFFVECDGEGATAYRATDDFSYFVTRNELSMSGDFGRYLRRVQAFPGALLVLLVRPDGLSTMLDVTQIARASGILRVARLPLPGQGELDWSLLRRAEAVGD